MKALKIIFLSLIAWLAGLMSILGVSFFKYEVPGLQDALGFGGLLFFACLVIIPTCYLPALFILKKIKPYATSLGTAAVLIVAGNLPVYVLLWLTGSSSMGSGEVFLFALGFIAVALVFGVLYPLIKKQTIIYP